MGILYSGTSPDFCKFHSIPTNPIHAIECFISGGTREIDTCKIEYQNCDEKSISSFFLCSSNIGLGAGIASRSNRIRKRVGDFAGTLCASIVTIAKAKHFSAKLKVDGEIHCFNDVLNITVGKNPHLASGIRLDLDIFPSNGKMFVFVVHGVSKSGLILSLGAAYTGKIAKNRAFTIIEATQDVEITPEPSNIQVEFDGDPWGLCPAKITVLKSSLKLVGCNE